MILPIILAAFTNVVTVGLNSAELNECAQGD